MLLGVPILHQSTFDVKYTHLDDFIFFSSIKATNEFETCLNCDISDVFKIFSLITLESSPVFYFLSYLKQPLKR